MEFSAPCQSKDRIGTQALIHYRTAPEKQTQTLSYALINDKDDLLRDTQCPCSAFGLTNM